MKRYTIGQLRGAYVAGRRDGQGDGPSHAATPPDRNDGLMRCWQWCIDRWGIADAFRPGEPTGETTLFWISGSPAGRDDALLWAAFDRMAAKIEAEYESPWAEVAIGLLEARCEEWITRKELVRRAG